MNFETVVSTGWRAGLDCKRAGWRSGQGKAGVTCVDLAPIKSSRYSSEVQIMNLCKQHTPIAGRNAHAHLLHPVCARGQINQLGKKLVS